MMMIIMKTMFRLSHLLLMLCVIWWSAIPQSEVAHRSNHVIQQNVHAFQFQQQRSITCTSTTSRRNNIHRQHYVIAMLPKTQIDEEDEIIHMQNKKYSTTSMYDIPNNFVLFDTIRRIVFMTFAVIITINIVSIIPSTTTTTTTAYAVEDIVTAVKVPTILPCDKVSGSSNSNNCVSTASVKQVDLFMLPWTWSDTISNNEIISRIKGVIASDPTLSLIEMIQSNDNNSNNDYYYRIHAARNVCTDEIELYINMKERIITFRSRQIDGPTNISDFGYNQNRLNKIRKQLQVVTIMGSTDNDENNNNNDPTEGITGQLKAFWGFQSGSGFESVLLDDDNE